MTFPPGLREAFVAYEDALMANDLRALQRLFADGPETLRGDPAGLLVGADTITAFRAARGGAPPRRLVDVEVRQIGEDGALVVAVTEPLTGGRGLQTQLWRRREDRWVVAAAHVSPPAPTFDRSVWRVVGDPLLAGADVGPLRGETLAVKDLFAVEGHRTGAGVPSWLGESAVAERSADAVQRLLDAGASVAGIARTDQLAYSLAGDNPHYGTPINPAVPGGLPGGSSSGSATAVATGAATIGLGTDTGGSVRVPASYQGLWGLRTTWRAVPATGVVPLAADFDTVGLLTRTADLLARAATVLLGGQPGGTPGALLTTAVGVAEFDAWASGLRPVQLPDLAAAAEVFRVHQARQAWQAHGAWIGAHPDALRGAARERFEAAAHISDEQAERAAAELADLRERIDDALGDSVLVLPSAASAAPRVWDTEETVDRLRSATLRLTCVAGITGRPAVSAPLLTTGGGPLGVQLVGPRGSDVELVRLAASLPVTPE